MKNAAYLLPPALALMLAGCVAQPTPLTVTQRPEPLVCSQWLPISYAGRHDTAETIANVRRANARRQAYCEAH